MFGKFLTVVGVGKNVHTHLYKNNEAYKETVDKGVDDVVRRRPVRRSLRLGLGPVGHHRCRERGRNA